MSLAGPHGDLPLLTAAQTRAADEAAVAAGASWDELLARAGGALAREVLALLRTHKGGVYGRIVLVAAGSGDNGGDGWVAASRLRARGVAVTVVAPRGLDVATSDHSSRARAAYLAAGGRATTDVAAIEVRSRSWLEHPIIVDCLLGTGSRGAPRGVVADAVEAIRWVASAPGTVVVACDVPSGVDADTGAVAEPESVVTADVTVTFGAAKRGLAMHPGAAHAGRVVIAGLGPRWRAPRPGSMPDAEVAYATDAADAAVAAWPTDADKRARGRVLVVAGSQRFAGAAALCGAAAVRSGAGLVTVATAGDRGVLLAREPGMMVHQLASDGTEVGGPAADAAPWVAAATAEADVIVAGPGLGYGAGARAVVEAVLSSASAGQVIVLDADALNVFRGDAASLRAAAPARPATDPAAGDGQLRYLDLSSEGASVNARFRLVLTPHARELARLLGVEQAEVLHDRAGAARALAEQTGAIVVAKGPGTLVVAPDSAMAVVTTGGPALGTGGSGDVLAGMLGAELAAAAAGATARRAAGPSGTDRSGTMGGVMPHDVAMTVHRHGMLGDRAGARSGGRATATDLLDLLPGLLAELAAPTDHRLAT